MDEVQAVPVNWLWHARLPFAMLTILDGDPSLGKSTIAIDVAARLTTSRALPGACTPVPPAAVAFLCSEDSAEHTIRPRLEAAGADLTLCHIIDTVTTGDTSRPVVLPHDLPFIEAFCIEKGVKLIVIDPLFGFVAAELDSHKDHSIRAVLHALKLTAEKTGAAVLALRHLNKSNGGAALYRGGGSIAVTAQARVVLSVGRNPDRHDERILAVAKTNLSKLPKALVYDLETVAAGGTEVSRVVWGGESDLTADAIVTRPGGGGGNSESRDRAEEFLARELAAGPLPSAQLIDKAAAEGIKKSTLFNARSKLGVKASKEGFTGRWVWSLPAAEDSPGEDSTPEDSSTPTPSESSGERLESTKIQPPDPPKIHAPETVNSSAAAAPTPRRKSTLRKKPAPPPSTGDPHTDPVAFDALLGRAGWTWAEVVNWFDERDEYAPGGGGYADLTGPQVHRLVALLTAIVAEREGSR